MKSFPILLLPCALAKTFSVEPSQPVNYAYIAKGLQITTPLNENDKYYYFSYYDDAQCTKGTYGEVYRASQKCLPLPYTFPGNNKLSLTLDCQQKH